MNIISQYNSHVLKSSFEFDAVGENFSQKLQNDPPFKTTQKIIATSHYLSLFLLPTTPWEYLKKKHKLRKSYPQGIWVKL